MPAVEGNILVIMRTIMSAVEGNILVIMRTSMSAVQGSIIVIMRTNMVAGHRDVASTRLVCCRDPLHPSALKHRTGYHEI